MAVNEGRGKNKKAKDLPVIKTDSPLMDKNNKTSKTSAKKSIPNKVNSKKSLSKKYEKDAVKSSVEESNLNLSSGLENIKDEEKIKIDASRKELVGRLKEIASKLGRRSQAKVKVPPVSSIEKVNTQSASIEWSGEDVENEKDKELFDLVVAYQKAYAAIDVGQVIPVGVRHLEKDLHSFLVREFENKGVDDLVSRAYASSKLNLEQRSLLREEVVKVFGTHISASRNNPDPLVVDVFALPVFGSVKDAREMMQNKTTMEQMCKMLVSSGYISNKSQYVALLNIPLKWSSLCKPSVLHGLSALWGSFVSRQAEIDEKTGSEIVRSVLKGLSVHEESAGTTGFVIAGVRVWKGSVRSYQENNDLLNKWAVVEPSKKSIAQSWWQLTVGHLLLSQGVKKGSVLIRPPVPPLVAQAQTLAWHITQQVYERLGSSSFDEINFISSNDNTMVLRAYDHRKRLVAQSDKVLLFDVVASPDDFSSLLKDECDSRGPRSQMRENIRSLDPFDSNK